MGSWPSIPVRADPLLIFDYTYYDVNIENLLEPYLFSMDLSSYFVPLALTFIKICLIFWPFRHCFKNHQGVVEKWPPNLLSAQVFPPLLDLGSTILHCPVKFSGVFIHTIAAFSILFNCSHWRVCENHLVHHCWGQNWNSKLKLVYNAPL